MSASSQKKIYETDDEMSGILKFHNIKTSSYAVDTVKIAKAIEELKDSIQKVEEEISAKNVQEEVRVETKAGPKIITRFSSEHYFKAVNHLDLFNLGAHYLKEYQEGNKNFAIYPDSTNVNSHETLLGLTSYFNYHEHLKVTLFVENFKNSFLAKHLKIEREEIRYFHNEQYSYKVMIAEGVEIIEYVRMRDLCKDLGRDGFDSLLDEIFSHSEISFWILPHLQTIDSEREFFFPLMRRINSTTILIREGKSKGKEVKEFVTHANKYNLKINGVLLAQKIREKKTNRNPFTMLGF